MSWISTGPWPPRPPRPPKYPRPGISLEGIEDFIRKVSSSDTALEGLTTREVCEQLIVPLTAEAQKSYCSIFENEDPEIGKATVFVSHAWGQRFMDTVEALRAWQEGKPKGFFSFDIFSVNMHKNLKRDVTWWTATIHEHIKQIRHTLLVLDWEHLVPLSRAWCLWEIFCTVDTNSDFEVIMSPDDHLKFITALVNDFDSLVFKTCTVDLEKASAFKHTDREMIFEAVRSTVGFAKLNQKVIELLKDWMIQSAREALGKLDWEDERRLWMYSRMALLLEDKGELNEAEVLLREALEGRRHTLGRAHPDTLASINDLGLLLQAQGKLEEAEPLLREALYGRRCTLGNTHPHTLGSISNLGMLLQAQGKLGEAEPLYREALEGQRRTLGDTHPSTLRSINDLGLLLQAQGKLGEAEPLLREALYGSKRTLGDTHPDTLSSINNLGTLLFDQGKLGDAELLLREALEGMRPILGDTHPHTLASINSLGTLLQTQGKLVEAEPLLRESLKGMNTLPKGRARQADNVSQLIEMTQSITHTPEDTSLGTQPLVEDMTRKAITSSKNYKERGAVVGVVKPRLKKPLNEFHPEKQTPSTLVRASDEDKEVLLTDFRGHIEVDLTVKTSLPPITEKELTPFLNQLGIPIKRCIVGRYWDEGRAAAVGARVNTTYLILFRSPVNRSVPSVYKLNERALDRLRKKFSAHPVVLDDWHWEGPDENWEKVVESPGHSAMFLASLESVQEELDVFMRSRHFFTGVFPLMGEDNDELESFVIFTEHFGISLEDEKADLPSLSVPYMLLEAKLSLSMNAGDAPQEEGQSAHWEKVRQGDSITPDSTETQEPSFTLGLITTEFGPQPLCITSGHPFLCEQPSPTEVAIYKVHPLVQAGERDPVEIGRVLQRTELREVQVHPTEVWANPMVQATFKRARAHFPVTLDVEWFLPQARINPAIESEPDYPPDAVTAWHTWDTLLSCRWQRDNNERLVSLWKRGATTGWRVTKAKMPKKSFDNKKECVKEWPFFASVWHKGMPFFMRVTESRGNPPLRFRNQLLIIPKHQGSRKFAEDGDSGASLRDAENRLLGFQSCCWGRGSDSLVTFTPAPAVCQAIQEWQRSRQT